MGGASLPVAGDQATRPAAESGTATQPADDRRLPTAPLGRTGVPITRLIMGASFPAYGSQVLGFAYRAGIRAFDNSHRYMNGNAEVALGEWVRRMGRREGLFIITKGKTTDPAEFPGFLDRALERMKLDRIDLFMVHGIEDPAIPEDSGGKWLEVKRRLVGEGRIRFMGFSTHANMDLRIRCVANAAKSKWVDGALIACDPVLIRSTPELDRALDDCAKSGVGLMAMKTSRGLGRFGEQPDDARGAFEQFGLSPHQAMQAGIWSDGRFAAACVEMPSRRWIEENCEGARSFRKPFGEREWERFDEAAKKLSRATCPGCDGSCQRAAGTRTDFCSIARYLAYAEENGDRARARELFAALPAEARDWAGADLAAASRACRGGLDFRSLLDRAERLIS
jgi:predicted aldo/keto reductase-like oxidoreductase